MTTSPVLVFGAGGHGRVVAETVLALGLRVDGFIDDGVPAGTVVLGLPVLGGSSWLKDQPPRVVALGLGDNRRREEVGCQLEEEGHTLGTFVHPTAWISMTSKLGAGTVAMARVVVNAEARVGRGVILNTGCIVEHECDVGDFAHLSPSATLGGRAVVGRRTHVGIGATLLHLARVGDDCVVGGGAVVLKELAAGLTAVGVPARPLARR
ncbi:MAG: acetyltransferase [Myxococcota bacterium]